MTSYKDAAPSPAVIVTPAHRFRENIYSSVSLLSTYLLSTIYVDIFCGKMSGSAKWMVCLLVAAKLNLVLSSQKSFDGK